MPSEPPLILCRCEDVTAAVVERAVRQGARTCDQVKKLTRAGMGPCQGRTCEHLLQLALATAGAVPVPRRVRPPLRGIPLARLAETAAGVPLPAGTVNARVLWGEAAGAATLSLDPPDAPEAPDVPDVPDVPGAGGPR